jgi:hypothetical protein
MFDQSFSAKNFYNILINENRKGRNIEKKIFEIEIFNRYSLRLKEINKKIRRNNSTFKNQYTKKRKPSNELYKRYKQFLQFKRRKLKQEKENKLLDLLEIISNNVQQPYFKFNLTSKTNKGKTIFTIDDEPETYFAMKQLQYNFQKLYGVKQANRFEIVNQIKCLLNDKFPKYIIRTDIKGFYENLPNKIIKEHLNADNLLSPKSKKFIKQILRDFEVISGATRGQGIPRGIGISAYLAEYYMRKIDKKINSLQNLSYYARYVDDIFIIFTPTYSYSTLNYFDNIKKIINPLELNKNKTNEIYLKVDENNIRVNGNLRPSPYNLNYLGYSYELNNNVRRKDIPEINIYLTSNKIKRYKDKIKISFGIYIRSKDKNKAYRHLKNRLKFLTGNTRLINNKSNILVGIYFSNMLLNKPEALKELDKYLRWYIQRYVKKSQHKIKLMKFSFFEGFTKKEKRFYNFNQTQFKQIVKAWKML